MTEESSNRVARIDRLVKDEEVSGFRLSNIETEDVRFLITAYRRHIKMLATADALMEYAGHAPICRDYYKCTCGFIEASEAYRKVPD